MTVGILYQAGFLVVLSLLGWVVARRLLGETRRWLAGPLGLVVGTTLYFWLSFAVIGVSSLFDLGSVSPGGLLLGLAVPIAVTLRRGPKWTRNEIVFGAVSVLLIVGSVSVFAYWNYTLVWNDSLELIAVGELIRMGELFEGHALLSRRPLYYGVFHAIARDLGIGYLWAWVPATAATFLFAFGAVLFDTLRGLGVRRLVAAGLVAVAGLLLLTSEFVQVHLALQHIHLMHGERFFWFALLMWLGTRDGLRSELWLAVGLLTPTVCMRLETILFLPLVVLVAMSTLPITLERGRHLTAWLGGVVLLGSVVLITTVEHAGFVDVKRAAMMPALGIVMLAAAAPKRVWIRLWPHAEIVANLILIACFVGVIIMSFTFFDSVTVSMIVTAINLTWTGEWEFLWWVLAVWLALTALAPKARFWKDTWFSLLVTSYMIFSVPLVVLRDSQPYRLGGMDSFNRMMMHVLPCIIFLAVGRLAAATSKRIEVMADTSKSASHAPSSTSEPGAVLLSDLPASSP